MVLFIASGFSTSTVVTNEVEAPTLKSDEIASDFYLGTNMRETQFAGARTHELEQTTGATISITH